MQDTHLRTQKRINKGTTKTTEPIGSYEKCHGLMRKLTTGYPKKNISSGILSKNVQLTSQTSYDNPIGKIVNNLIIPFLINQHMHLLKSICLKIVCRMIIAMISFANDIRFS